MRLADSNPSKRSMRFTFNHLTYEVPEGIDIVVAVGEEEADFNFRLVDSDHDLPMMGGTDENDNPLPTWEDLGIRKLP